jgi:parallel beta-helix repeat protein
MPGADDQDTVQAALLNVVPGGSVVLGEGTFNFTQILSLTVDNVTLSGQGSDKTILSFAQQTVGASGVKVNANGFTAMDFAIQDSPGDGLKVEKGNNLTVQRVRVEWTGGPQGTNGPYGIYPVECNGVLVEDSTAIGASDTGIYVGQSQNIIVRGNTVQNNVSGIEIENSQNADVYNNTATQNTAGILVFGLPGLQVEGGGQVRVYNNNIVSNNTDNFAPPGNIVAMVPRGTGTFVMANNQVEVFGNTIQDNETVSMAVVSYLLTGLPIQDPSYDPYSYAVYMHDNTIIGGGDVPDPTNQLGLALSVYLRPLPVPDLIFDGFVNPAKLVNGVLPDNLRICFQNNNHMGMPATFANVDGPALAMILAGQSATPNIQRDISPYNCSQPALPPVTLPGGAS